MNQVENKIYVEQLLKTVKNENMGINIEWLIKFNSCKKTTLDIPTGRL